MIVAMQGGSSPPSQTNVPASPRVVVPPRVVAPPRVVEYVVLDQWAIPNGGYVKLIVIDSVHANEADLRALGDELRFDTRGDRNAFNIVFSDRRAAAMYRTIDRASKKDLQFYDKHFVANYQRNINTGHHTFTIMPNGLNGRQIDVAY